jgi:hypothetical protein
MTRRSIVYATLRHVAQRASLPAVFQKEVRGGAPVRMNQKLHLYIIEYNNSGAHVLYFMPVMVLQ